MTHDELFVVAFHYLEKNPERFNSQEKMKFINGLKEWLTGKCEAMDDEVYDFLFEIGLIKGKSREANFKSYLNDKYGFLTFRRVLDVGAGRMCKLSEMLAKKCPNVTAMDPKIRLTDAEAAARNIKIKRDVFECDKFASDGRRGTSVSKYDLLVGLEPCDATEHIIRQGLKYDKQFDILLCAAPHIALDGRTFRSYEEWYKHLESISSEVHIQEYGTSFIATNDPQMSNELGR